MDNHQSDIDKQIELTRLKNETLKLEAEKEKQLTKQKDSNNMATFLVIVVIAVAVYFLYKRYTDAKIKEENPFHKME